MMDDGAGIDGVKDNGRGVPMRIGKREWTARVEAVEGTPECWATVVAGTKMCAVHLFSFGGAAGSTSFVPMAKLGV